MNKEGRTKLDTAITKLEDVYAVIEELQSEEQDKYDNLSEGLQASERGEKFQENSDNLSAAIDALDSAKSSVQEAIEAIANVE